MGVSQRSQPTLGRRSRWCGVLALIEAVALAAYCVLLAITALHSSGATTSAPVVEITIFVIFAIGIFLVARGMLARSINARAPYFLTQVFVLIIAYTLLVGDGAPVKIVGGAVGLLGVVGIGLGVAMVIGEDDDTTLRLPESESDDPIEPSGSGISKRHP